MQGQRGTVGSLPETLDFDLGSSSNTSAMDQQTCWNNLRNPPESRIPDYLLTQTDMNIAFMSSVSRERQVRWCPGEASSSSSNAQNETGPVERKLELGWPSSASSCPLAGPVERKLELGWPSSASSCPLAGPRFEQQQQQSRESPNNVVVVDNSASLMFGQSSNSNSNAPVQPSLNLGFVGHSGSNNNSSHLAPFPNGNSPFRLPPRRSNGGFLVSENDGRQSPVDGPRMSCKRKAVEGNVGPSSSGGNSSYFQRTDSGPRPGLSGPTGPGTGLSIYTSSEQGTPGLGLGFPDPIVAENTESSHRNVRMRTNSSNPHPGRSARRSDLLSSQPPMSLLPVDHSLDLIRPISAGDNSVRNPAAVADLAPPLQNAHLLRWTGASSSSSSSSLPSSVAFGGERDPLSREELGSRSILPRTVPVPAAELRNLIRNPAVRGVASGSINPRAANPALGPVWQPHNNPPPPQPQPQPHHPRRFSEYLRRSLFASSGTESGGQSSNYLPVLQPGQTQERVGPPGGSHNQTHARLASWLERHHEGGLGVPYSLRALGAAGGEGSSRIVSEQIRNVLGLIRRGESLRFEDVMILDPAVFAGVADIHDRHRDMRLDVDNMSYEELLALEERIGNVSTGVSEETVSKRLKQKYFVSEISQSENEPCCICQEDYNEGDNVGTLQCGHDFHTDCIKQWLTHKNLCPICKTTALKS